MFKIRKGLLNCCLLVVLLTTVFLLLSSSANAQETTDTQASPTELASGNNPTKTIQPSKTALATPVYKEFMGITLGMGADEVRAKLGHLKLKGERQDFFVFSESESAQIVYDGQGKVTTISVDYVNKEDGPPSMESVLGESVQPKPDGSIYQLKRYPSAGYWVAYSRTAGDNPIVTITMQKI